MMADDGEQLEATELTIAWLSNPHTRAQAEDVSAMLGSVLTALRTLDEPSTATPAGAPAAPEYTPAVSVRRSLASPDHIISMIDGKPYRSLTRHLSARGLTPAEYRRRYGLKPDYPMIAPSYSESRRTAAKQHQFGRKPAADAAPAPSIAAPEPSVEVTPEPQSEAAPEPAAPAKRRRLGISGAKQPAKARPGSGKRKSTAEPEVE